MTRATMPGKHNYSEYTPEQLQLICDKLSALEDKAQSKLNDTDKYDTMALNLRSR